MTIRAEIDEMLWRGPKDGSGFALDRELAQDAVGGVLLVVSPTNGGKTALANALRQRAMEHFLCPNEVVIVEELQRREPEHRDFLSTWTRHEAHRLHDTAMQERILIIGTISANRASATGTFQGRYHTPSMAWAHMASCILVVQRDAQQHNQFWVQIQKSRFQATP